MLRASLAGTDTGVQAVEPVRSENAQKAAGDPAGTDKRLKEAAELLRSGALDEAEQRCREVLNANSQDARALSYMMLIRSGQGDVTGEVIYGLAALRSNPNLPAVANNLAWILATHHDAGFRNGKAAVMWAQRACQATRWTRPDMLGTLAAAHAEAGRHELAALRALEALAMLTAEDPPARRAQIEQQLACYEAGRAYHQPVAAADGEDGNRLPANAPRPEARAFGDLGLPQRMLSNPEGWRLLERFAWMLAVHEDPRVADASEAMRFAQAARRAAGAEPARTLGTLAAAHAAAEQFGEAARLAKHAMAAAQGDRKDALRGQLKLYEARVPYRTAFAPPFEPAPPNTSHAQQRRGAYLLYLTGKHLDSAGRPEEAVNVFNLAAQRDPTFYPVHADLANRRLRSGDVDAATRHFLAALRSRPDDAESRFTLGMIYEGSGQLGRAVKLYDESLRLDPHQPVAANNLAWIRATAADANLRDSDQAVHWATQACEATGHRRGEMVGTLAAAYAAAGRTDEAVATAKEALALATADGDEKLASNLQEQTLLYVAGRPYREDPRGFVELGTDRLRRGELDQAERLFRAALRLQPKQPRALLSMGMIREAQDQAGGALIFYRAAARLEPNLAVASNNLAWILATYPDSTVRDGKAAVRAAQRAAAATDHQKPLVLGTLAAAYAQAGRFDKAIEAARDGLERAKAAGDLEAVESLAHHVRIYEAGLTYSSDGRSHLFLAKQRLRNADRDGAVQLLNTVLRMSPDNPQALFYLGMIHQQQGKIDEAVEHFSRAVRSDPTMNVAANNLAFILSTDTAPDRRDANEAIRLAQRLCAETGNSRPEYLDTLAAAYAAAGRFDDAVTTINKALRLLPHDENDGLSRAMLRRKQLYEAGQPYRVDR